MAGPQRSRLRVQLRRSGPLRARRRLRAGHCRARTATTRDAQRHHVDRRRPGRSPPTGSAAAPVVAAMTDPLGHVTGWEHDERGRVTARTDPLGRVTRYSYDARGNLTTITRPDGSQAHAEYDERDLPVAWPNPAGTPGGRSTTHAATGPGSPRRTAPSPASATTATGTWPASPTRPAPSPWWRATAAGLPVRGDRPGRGARPLSSGIRLGRVTRITGAGRRDHQLTWTPEGRPVVPRVPRRHRGVLELRRGRKPDPPPQPGRAA